MGRIGSSSAGGVLPPVRGRKDRHRNPYWLIAPTAYTAPAVSWRVASGRGCAAKGDPLESAGFRAGRCRSSVVEHSLGKGEVESSILSGSTIPIPRGVRNIRQIRDLSDLR